MAAGIITLWVPLGVDWIKRKISGPSKFNDKYEFGWLLDLKLKIVPSVRIWTQKCEKNYKIIIRKLSTNKRNRWRLTYVISALYREWEKLRFFSGSNEKNRWQPFEKFLRVNLISKRLAVVETAIDSLLCDKGLWSVFSSSSLDILSLNLISSKVWCF